MGNHRGEEVQALASGNNQVHVEEEDVGENPDNIVRRRTEHLFSEFAHPEVQRLENSTLELVEALGQHRDTFLAKVAAKLKVAQFDPPYSILQKR